MARRVTTRYQANPQAKHLILSSPQMRAALDSRAEKIVAAARSNGALFSRKGWKTEARLEGGWVVRAGTNAPAAHWDEWGSVNRSPRAPLRRALISLGLGSNLKQAGKP